MGGGTVLALKSVEVRLQVRPGQTRKLSPAVPREAIAGPVSSWRERLAVVRHGLECVSQQGFELLKLCALDLDRWQPFALLEFSEQRHEASRGILEQPGPEIR